MRTFGSAVLGFAIGVFFALQPGCSGSSGSCSIANCPGCCDATGHCQAGNVTTACGSSGATCTACLSNQNCELGLCTNVSGNNDAGCKNNGNTCSAASQCCSNFCDGTLHCAAFNACNASSCPSGCCDSTGNCLAGTVAAACGSTGNACTACTGGQACQSNGSGGQCVQSDGGACGPSNCSGCCDPAGACQTGTSPFSCGSNGLSCTGCPSSWSCVAGQCRPPAGDGGSCGPGNCAGCCDSSGLCQSGTGAGACGQFGGSCFNCASFGDVCQNGSCVMPTDAGQSPLGGACTSNANCVNVGGACLNAINSDGGPSGFPGGYCVGFCAADGGGCNGASLCPSGGPFCIDFEPCSNPGGGQGICRTGYVCDYFASLEPTDAGFTFGPSPECIPDCHNPGIPGCPNGTSCNLSGSCR